MVTELRTNSTVSKLKEINQFLNTPKSKREKLKKELKIFKKMAKVRLFDQDSLSQDDEDGSQYVPRMTANASMPLFLERDEGLIENLINKT